MTHAVFVIDAVRTPLGKLRGALAPVRADDLAAHALRALLARNPAAGERVDEVILGATNQAGEDNRNVARMAVLLAGLPYEIPAVTVNRLCGSGLEAVQSAYRGIVQWASTTCVIAGGVESMTRAPFVMAKPDEPFTRTPPAMFDTSLGWRFTNPRLAERFPLESMGDTAENVAAKYNISRDAQDRFALASQHRAAAAWARGAFAAELAPVELAQRKGPAVVFDRDESVRGDTTIEALAKLQPAFRKGGTVTAGNSSPLNDGAAAVLLASGAVVERLGLTPLARVRANAVAGVEPGLMGTGPIPAVQKLLQRSGLDDLRGGHLGAQRGLRRAGPRVRRAARPRPREGEPRRRRHRPGPPHRVLWRARRRDAPSPHEAREPPPRRGLALHRRGSGHRDALRAGVMRALVFDGALRVEARPDPRPGPGEALIAVRRAGICNTDVEIARGYMGFHGVLGHEFVGEVLEVHDEAHRGWVGRRVAGEINLGCGACGRCLAGLSRHCKTRTVLGILGRDGALAERVTLPVANLHAVPDALDDDGAVFIEPVAACFEVLEQLKVEPDARVVVLGDGKLGLMLAQVLRATGCDLTLVGKHPRKLALAAAAGVNTAHVDDALVG